MTTDEWEPLTDPYVVEMLNSTEVVEGYHDGRADEPRPGPNRSIAYRHGWWVGQRDGGHRKPHPADVQLVRNMRVAKVGVFDPDLFSKRAH